MENYKKLVDILISNDYMREWMKSPFLVRKKVVATNGYVLCAFDKENYCIDGLFDLTHKIEQIYPQEITLNHKIDVKKFRDLISKVETVEDFNIHNDIVSCDECDGHGAVDWEYSAKGKSYTESFDCPVCAGAGQHRKIVKIPNGKKILNPKCNCKILKSYFAVNKISILLEAADLFNANEITLLAQKQFGCSMFRVHDIDIIIMPVSMEDHDAEKISFVL